MEVFQTLWGGQKRTEMIGSLGAESAKVFVNLQCLNAK
jgi:hypothetical protein